MTLQEAAFFHNDYSELMKELRELDLSENVDGTTTQEEKILS